MSEKTIIREGTPCLGAALAIATFGFVALAAIAVGCFLLPTTTIQTGHYVLGSLIGALAVALYPWAIMDTKNRKHVLTESGVIYRCGILSRFEIEIPYRSIQAVTVRRSIMQRILGCGDVRVSAHGVSGPVLVSQQDMNSICIRSISDFKEVADVLREKMNQEIFRDKGFKATS